MLVVVLVSCAGSDTDESIDLKAPAASAATQPPSISAAGVPTVTEAPPQSGSSPSEMASAADSQDFTTRLTSHSSGDYALPRSLDDVLEGVDAAVLGRIVGVDHGRRWLLEDDNPTIVASHVNVEVQPDEMLFGELPATGEPMYVEFPWPNNLSLDGLRETIPTDARVVVLAQFFGAEAADLSATAVAAGVSEPIPTNLVLVSPWGLMIESDAEGVMVPITESDGIVRVAQSIGIDVQSFDDIADLLRQQS